METKELLQEVIKELGEIKELNTVKCAVSQAKEFIQYCEYRLAAETLLDIIGDEDDCRLSRHCCEMFQDILRRYDDDRCGTYKKILDIIQSR